MKTQVKAQTRISKTGKMTVEIMFAMLLSGAAFWLGLDLIVQYPRIMFYLALTIGLGAVPLNGLLLGVMYPLLWLLNLDGDCNPWLNLFVLAIVALALIVLGHLAVAYAVAFAGCAGVIFGEVWSQYYWGDE
ncbi:MAG: hypothetical protein IPP97_11370 [Candidatus Obscuribacter sp.]|jgi:hypothetical protein|nr:hypothetical protein [Candidatus Obscuribacter sp.]MBL0186326.1 hypothetical protein [Candidatus Obscuribacter sp.]MBP6349556.1 hypothetical protein [Candidatus Obscuribacter sp.]MBP6593426.1 hypothetical protein [Candidatus Obscuribacter sp.]